MKKMGKRMIAVLATLMIFQMMAVPVLAVSKSKNYLYSIMAKKAVPDNIKSEYVEFENGINFNYSPVYYPNEEKEDYSVKINNGKGVYMISSTAKDLYPIYYYRGEVDDNNVIFGGYCWKMVRTTDTGGVKIIYNGEPNEDGTCVDSIKFFDPSLNLGESYWGTYDGGYMTPNDFKAPSFELYDITDSKNISWTALAEKEEQEKNEVSGTYYYSSEVRYENGKYTLVNPKSYTFKKMDYENEEEYDREYNQIDGMVSKYTCLNDGETCDEITYILNLYYDDLDSEYNRLEYVTFQNGETKESTMEELKKQKIIIGSDVIYQDGKYTLQNTAQTSLIEREIGNRHYTCFSASNSCEKVAYIYDDEGLYYGDSDYDGQSLEFFSLSNGDTVETLQAAYDVYKNISNEKDSLLKETLDKWYSEHMLDYTKYLEDTVWCNDRNVYYGNLDKNSVLNFYDDVRFASSQRNYPKYWNDKDFVAKPSLACPNKNDSFTVSDENGNGKLTYPVATITADELLYAGDIIPQGAGYCIGFYGVTMSMGGSGWISYIDWDYLENMPLNINNINSEVMPIGGCPVSKYLAFPVVSLKKNMVCEEGDGTPEHPCIVVEGEMPEPPVPETVDNLPTTILASIMGVFLVGIGFFLRKNKTEKRIVHE